MTRGVLYVVATPIGNLEDMSQRALKVLKEVNVIACEDTRHTHKLLQHFSIRTPTLSYHQHNERARAEQIVRLLQQGQNIAVVSDAGMPGISDPGQILVQEAVGAGIAVVPIPGASALVAALAASGFPTDRFVFEGFLPAKAQARRARLQQLEPETRTLVFYEAPHRLLKTLADMAEIFGPQRRAAVARELTKIHEEFVRDTLQELSRVFSERVSIKGEVVVLVEGKAGGACVPLDTEPEEEARRLMEEKGISRKEAAKQVAHKRGFSSRALYQQLLP